MTRRLSRSSELRGRALSAIAEAVPHPELEMQTVGTELLAKGYGVDQIALLLERAGIERYMVEIGGEVRA